ncbi:MAG: hypothetical protein HZB68_03620 [Candidatus Aenigmarchaeota archaeon]|nr:hypothetical protein [Candidatus Aenigmarchaeota archaeon]
MRELSLCDKDLKAVKLAIEKASKYPAEECLDALRRGMNEIGYNFQDTKEGRKGAYMEALKRYGDIRESETPLESFDPFMKASFTGLPGTRLEFNGKVYFIHGIFHGGDSVGFPSIGAKDFVNDIVKEYHNPKEGKHLFYEQKMDDKMLFFDMKGEDFCDWYVIRHMDKYDRDRVHERMDRKIDPSCQSARTEAFRGAVKNVKMIPKAKEVMHRTEQLPEPLLIAYEREDADDGNDVVTLVEGRSEHMAKKMFGCNAKEVHAIVGVLHEDQIAYFLKKMHGE